MKYKPWRHAREARARESHYKPPPERDPNKPLPVTRPTSISCTGCGYEGPVYTNVCPECSRRVF